MGRKWVVSGWVVGRDQEGAVEGYVSLYAGYVQYREWEGWIVGRDWEGFELVSFRGMTGLHSSV